MKKTPTKREIVYDLANALSSGDKTMYKVTAGDLTALQNQIDLVSSLNTQRRSSVVSRQTENDMLTALMKDTTLFVHETLDPLMKAYRLEDAELYQGWLNARTVINPAESHAQITGMVTTDDNTPMPRVKVSASNGINTFEEMTDKHGFYKLPVSPELYDLTFEFPDYTPEEFTNVLVDAGEREKINVKLKKAN